jgi:hypothetical protein
MREPELTGVSAAPESADAVVAHLIDGDFYRWLLAYDRLWLELHSGVVQQISDDLLQSSVDNRYEDVGGLFLGVSETAGTKLVRVAVLEPCRSPDLHRVLAFWSHRAILAAGPGAPREFTAVLGFYRIVFDDDLEFSDLDRNLAERYFADPGKVFLLVKLSRAQTISARAFFWNGDSIESEPISFPEVGTKPVSIPQRAVQPEVRPEPPKAVSGKVRDLPRVLPPLPAPPLVEEEPEQEEEHASQFTGVGSRKSLIALIVFLIAFSAGVYFWGRRESSSSSTPPVQQQGGSSLGMGITGSATGLVLTWNTEAPGLGSAKVGLVTVRDGNREQELPLDKTQLLTGKLFYVPTSTMVRFTMQVFAEDLVLRDYAMAIVPRDGPAETAVSPEAKRAESPRRQPPAPRQQEYGASRLRLTPTPPSQPPPGVESKVVAPQAAPSAKSNSVTAFAIPSPPTKDITLATPPPINGDQSVRLQAPNMRSVEQQAPPPEAPRPAENTESRAAPQPQSVPADAAAAPAAAPPASTTAVVQPEPPSNQPTGQYIPPQPIRQAQPSVPPGLRALINREIRIEVILSISATGAIQSVQPAVAEGPLQNSLARLAVSAARLWKFRPALRNNRPVPGDVRVQFFFGPSK